MSKIKEQWSATKTGFVRAGPAPIAAVYGNFDRIARGYKTDALMVSRANMIAAAPDLLEFVQQIFNGIDTGMITIDTPADEALANVLSRGRKALSKATGAS